MRWKPLFFISLLVLAVCSVWGWPRMLAVAYAQPATVQSDNSQLLMPPPMIEPPNPDGSRCFTIFNTAPYTVTGSMVTALYETADATQARQRLNFRLKPKESHRYCSFGPFYPGERLELVLRTLVPVFSCYTVAQGEITIRGEIKASGGSRSWVDCI